MHIYTDLDRALASLHVDASPFILGIFNYAPFMTSVM